MTMYWTVFFFLLVGYFIGRASRENRISRLKRGIKGYEILIDGYKEVIDILNADAKSFERHHRELHHENKNLRAKLTEKEKTL